MLSFDVMLSAAIMLVLIGFVPRSYRLPTLAVSYPRGAR